MSVQQLSTSPGIVRAVLEMDDGLLCVLLLSSVHQLLLVATGSFPASVAPAVPVQLV